MPMLLAAQSRKTPSKSFETYQSICLAKRDSKEVDVQKSTHNQSNNIRVRFYHRPKEMIPIIIIIVI